MKDAREPWLKPIGASSKVLSDLKAAVPSLPSSYLSLLASGNGGETSLASSAGNFCLDSAEFALDYFKSDTYTATDVFVFGGDGGGTLFAFDMSKDEPWPIVEYDPIDPEGSMAIVADSFDSFLQLAGDEA